MQEDVQHIVILKDPVTKLYRQGMVVASLQAITTSALVLVRIPTRLPSHFPSRKCEVSNWSVDSGIPTPDPQEAYYPDNDNESMEIYEEPTTQGQITNQGQVPNPPRRERDRDSRERHEEPRQKHRSHR